MKKTLYLLCCVAFWGGIVGCNMKEELVNTAKHPITLKTKAINPEYYDWEVEDYMPTPPSQSILVPWATGNGGLDAFYGLPIKCYYLWEFKFGRFNRLFEVGD